MNLYNYLAYFNVFNPYPTYLAHILTYLPVFDALNVSNNYTLQYALKIPFQLLKTNSIQPQTCVDRSTSDDDDDDDDDDSFMLPMLRIDQVFFTYRGGERIITVSCIRFRAAMMIDFIAA
jgi:hypothetical protein